MLLSLVIPTYNERPSIVALIQRTTAILDKSPVEFEIIVVDDDSSDGTWQAVEELARQNHRLKLIRRQDQKDLATAVVTGWKTATGNFLGAMDGDLQHPPEVLTLLLKPLVDSQADIVIASRNVAGGGVSEWRPFRKLIALGARLATILVLPRVVQSVRDPMSGYFLMKRTVIESVALKPVGYKILLEVLARGKYRTITEIPYRFDERKNGASKLGPKQCWDFLVHLWRLWRDRRMG